MITMTYTVLTMSVVDLINDLRNAIKRGCNVYIAGRKIIEIGYEVGRNNAIIVVLKADNGETLRIYQSRFMNYRPRIICEGEAHG